MQFTRGDKYTCSGCSTKFYSLGKKELVCPKCGIKLNKAYSDTNKKIKLAEAKKDLPTNEQFKDDNDIDMDLDDSDLSIEEDDEDDEN